MSCLSEVVHQKRVEPPHEETNKVSVCPAKTQISLCMRPVWSESSLSTWRNIGSLATHWMHCEDWSDWADAQADLSLRWAHSHFVGFVMRRFSWFLFSSVLEKSLVGLWMALINWSRSRTIMVGWKLLISFWQYRNVPKFSDRQIWANRADPDQGLHCLPFRLHRLDSLLCGRATLFKF